FCLLTFYFSIACSDLPRIVGPMQQCLPLAAPAIQIARPTMFFQLRDVTANSAPTRDLPQVILAAASAIISAIPLEPAARVLGMNPTFAPPFRQSLRGVHSKIIERSPSPIR